MSNTYAENSKSNAATVTVAPSAFRSSPLIQVPLESNFALFAQCFAIWVLIDQSYFSRWIGIWPAVLTAPLAGLVFIRPNSVKLFVALMAASLWAYAWKSPFHVNNVFIGAFFSMVVLASAGVYFLKHRRLPQELGELESICFPAIRVSVILVFLGAVLHKSNSAFLTPSMSCAVIHTSRLLVLLTHVMHLLHLKSLVHFLPSTANPTVATGTIYLTLATEFGIPLLLTLGWLRLPSRKLITFAIFIALGFHLVMSLNGFQNFSALAVAYYVPFLPANFYRTISANILRLKRSQFAAWTKAFIRLCAFGVGLFAAQLMFCSTMKVLFPHLKIPSETLLRKEGWIGFNFLFWPGISLLFVYISFIRRWRENRMVGTLPVWWTYPLLALVILNLMCPYLGLKTENSFAMFSNLLTEGDKSHWNNLIMPASLRIFHYQDHLVVIKSIKLGKSDGATDTTDADNDLGSNPPGLAELKPDDHFQMVEFEFRRNVSQACQRYSQPITIDYEVDGVPRHVEDAHKVPELANGNGYWIEKLMFFRKIPNSPYGICLH